MVTVEETKRQCVNAQTGASQVQFQGLLGRINGKEAAFVCGCPVTPGAPLSGPAGRAQTALCRPRPVSCHRAGLRAQLNRTPGIY